MKNVLFVPGLFAGHEIYHIIKLPEFALSFDCSLRVHRRHRAINLKDRADALAVTLREYPANETLHLIVNSAGAIDLYHCLYLYPELSLRIKSIISVGGPFAGSLIADDILEKKEECKVWDLIMSAEFLIKGIEIATELSIKERTKYNETHKLAHAIVKKFYCYPVETSAKWKANLTSHKGYDLFKKKGLESDCTVSVASQTFGEIIKIVEGEHKSAVFPVRYGWPWNHIWNRTFTDCLNFINLNFNV